jgi:DNA-binding HxlR family transcriptional regulator
MYSTIQQYSKISLMRNNGHNIDDCQKSMKPVRDALDVLSGKWKLPIIIALSHGNRRFTELSRDVPNITDRMLSKELRELELNQLVKRTVYDAIPVAVEYSLTDYGDTLDSVIDALRKWGLQHRRRIMTRTEKV